MTVLTNRFVAPLFSFSLNLVGRFFDSVVSTSNSSQVHLRVHVATYGEQQKGLKGTGPRERIQIF
jgi:hypothetical protein